MRLRGIGCIQNSITRFQTDKVLKLLLKQDHYGHEGHSNAS